MSQAPQGLSGNVEVYAMSQDNRLEIDGCCRECVVTWPIKDGPAVARLRCTPPRPICFAACNSQRK